MVRFWAGNQDFLKTEITEVYFKRAVNQKFNPRL